MEKLTRAGIAGLELTREEVIDLYASVDALARKAQCREVHSDILDALEKISNGLKILDDNISELLNDFYGD